VKVITLDRQAIEAEERQAAIERAKEYIESVGATEEQAQEILAEAESYQVTPEAFKTRVLDAALQLSSRPLPVESPISNQVRILPPWAVKEVSVQVRNVPPIYTSE